MRSRPDRALAIDDVTAMPARSIDHVVVNILLAMCSILIKFRCSRHADPIAVVADSSFCQRFGSISSAIRKESVPH